MTNSSRNNSFGDFSKRVVIVAIVALVISFVGYFFWTVGYGLLVAFSAVLFAILLDGIQRLITRFIPLPRTLAILAAALAVGIVIFGGFTLGGARVAQQLPELNQTIQREAKQLKQTLEQRGINVNNMLSEDSDKSSSFGKEMISEVGHYVSVPISILTDIVVIIVAGVYFAAKPHFYLNALVRLFPPSRQNRIKQVLGKIDQAMRRWFAGRILAMVVIGIVVSFGLWLMGVKLAFLLGFIAGIMTFIPYLGAVISAIPAILVGLLQGPLIAVYVAVLFLFAHVLEGYILVPSIQERQVSMAPGYLILCQLLGGLFAGVMGILLATPIAVTITIIVQTLYLQDVLGEQAHILGQKD